MSIQTTVIYCRLDLERQICLFASTFLFSFCKIFQSVVKEMLSKEGLLSLKIVSEQLTTSGRTPCHFSVLVGVPSYFLNLSINSAKIERKPT